MGKRRVNLKLYALDVGAPGMSKQTAGAPQLKAKVREKVRVKVRERTAVVEKGKEKGQKDVVSHAEGTITQVIVPIMPPRKRWANPKPKIPHK